MIDINKILDYIESSAISFLNGSDEKGILSRTKAIRKKQSDENLYLAVVGEFSSGKSTFINALLGFRLLKEAVMPTTACATYLQKKGRKLHVEVKFFDGNTFSADEDNFGSLYGYLNCTYHKKTTDLKSIIEVLTSDQNIAKTVKSLNIHVPNAKIPKNLVIVDTPGFNPGSASVDNHFEITKYVVEEIADIALVLTPQEQAMSATLLKFLNDTLKRCLHRCIYVITKMDTLPTEHREETFDYVKQRIIYDLGVQDPRLYAESAITTLPVKKVPEEKVQIWNYYQRKFELFEQEVWGVIQKQKEFVLSEHVHNLVNDVVNHCVDKLKEKQVKLKDDKAFLEGHRIEKIQDVCNKMVSTSSNAIHYALNSISTSTSRAESESKRISESIISEGIMSLEKFKTEKMPKIKSAVESESQKVLSEINSQINRKVRTCVDEQIKKMGDVFAAHYINFPSLKPSEAAPKANLVRFKTPNMSFKIAINKVEALDSKENESAGWGAVVGGTIGFLLGGPFGAVAGAAFGAGGGVIAGDQSDKMRQSVTPLVKSEISSYFSSLHIKIEEELAGIKVKYTSLIKNFAEEHIVKYGNAVNNLIKERQSQIDSLNKQIQSLKNVVRNLQNIQEDIKQELILLKIKK